ncbi:MAG: sulfotransferase [Gemmatimonadota bacterium]
MASVGSGALPNLIVIGAAKSGTTSLSHYLNLHPQVAMTREKELHFFSKPEVWGRGVEWYAAQFDRGTTLRGEASVTYSSQQRYPWVPSRMAALVPDARLLYIVREPIRRIVSAWGHRYSDGKENRSLDEALESLEGNALVERSLYATQLEHYLPHYPMRSIHVISSEALRSARPDTMAEVYAFLELEPFDSPRFDEVRNESRFKRRKGRIARLLQRMGEAAPARLFDPDTRRRVGRWLYGPFTRPFEPGTMSPETHGRLRELLAPEVSRLRTLTGHDFNEWTEWP